MHGDQGTGWTQGSTVQHKLSFRINFPSLADQRGVNQREGRVSCPSISKGAEVTRWTDVVEAVETARYAEDHSEVILLLNPEKGGMR